MLRRCLLSTMAALIGLSLPAEPAEAQRRREREVRITGSGASFPAPLYFAWFREFNRQTPGFRITCQSTGSGAGIRAFFGRIVDFAASDAAMSDEDIARVDGGTVILLMTAGLGLTPVFVSILIVAIFGVVAPYVTALRAAHPGAACHLEGRQPVRRKQNDPGPPTVLLPAVPIAGNRHQARPVLKPNKDTYGPCRATRLAQSRPAVTQTVVSGHRGGAPLR